MTKQGRKIIRILLITIIVVVVGGFALNWFLRYRLQSHLNKYLSEEIYKATNGFYQFSFEDLSIGLFSGELSIKGIELKPDSTTYTLWDRGDSLPSTYFNINVGEIHFKGINLIWQRNYKNLNFKLFEINSPDIKIYAPLTIDTVKETSVNKDQTLYDIISPYMNVISATNVNLNHMNVSYIVSDSVSPVIYSLKDADFHAYGFLLNKNSYSSGKLLYCNDFEFIADKPQVLLFSDEIVLNTNSIKLSTIDSFIQIRNVQIAPRDSLWYNRTENAGQYLKADIQAVDVKGVGFTRENAVNYLHARSFIIDSTEIQYHSVIDDKTDKEAKKPDNDSVGSNWSLYEVTAPLLRSISIDKVGIEKTRFNYSITQNGNTDVYSLKQFDFHANNFLVDPTSEREKKFWYVDNFVMEGKDINGLIESNNSDVNISSLFLSTIEKRFNVSDINIKPISTTAHKDYIKGKVAGINIDELDYDSGVSAGQLKLDSVNVEYFKVSQKKSSSEANEPNPQDMLDFLAPYANYLSVKQINLKDANIIVHDRIEDISYRINHLNFYASDFLINEQTRNTSRYLFTYDDIGVSFTNFDNLLPGKQYRLKIKKADVSTLSGKIRLEGLDFIPQEQSWDKAPDTYFAISTPLIDMSGFNNDLYANNQTVAINTFKIDNPLIKIVKSRNPIRTDSKETGSSILSVVKSLSANKVDINKISVSYLDKTTKDSLQTSLQAFHANLLKWDINKHFNLGELIVEKPYINYSKNGKTTNINSTSAEKDNLELLGQKVAIGKFIVSDGNFNIEQAGNKFSGDVELFDLSRLVWNKSSLLDVAGLDIRKPTINIREAVTAAEKKKKEDSSGKDIYSVLQGFVDKLSVQELDITDANINYTHALNGTEEKQQKLNKTNLDLLGLVIDAKGKNYDIQDVRFNTKDLKFPINNGFYTLNIGEIDVNKQAATLKISDSRMISTYPKWEFAHHHPTHKDWFDVSAGNITLSGLDYSAFFRQNRLRAKHLQVDDVMLQNLKNQQIEITHNIMPLIYEGLYKLPVELDIDSADVSNFSVIYEELAKKGTYPGAITFIGMNGKVSGLTNIVSSPNQYINLDVDGMFMNRGYFKAKWDIPVDPNNDCFILEGHVPYLDLRDLNRIFTPLANAEVKTGVLNDFWFRTEASSVGARADMRFLYNDLKINILKNNEEESPNKFISGLANLIIRSNNPNKPKDKPRTSHLTIERDPYHSTFNYFWQILQPPLAESVGVSQGTQNFARKVSGFFTKVKNFFTGGGKEKNKEEKKD